MVAVSFQLTEAYAEHLTTFVTINSDASGKECHLTEKCYSPSQTIVSTSGKVVWTNLDSSAHTVTSGSESFRPDGYFDSGLLMAGDIFFHDFDDYEPGTYPYFCMVHPWMTGYVIVEAEVITRDGLHDPAKIYSIKASGTKFSIDYRISSGKITSVIANNDTNSLIIQLSQVKNGELTIILPRELIDAKVGTRDKSFLVIVDEEQIDYNEISNSLERILIIPFQEHAELIEITGTKIEVSSTVITSKQATTPSFSSKMPNVFSTELSQTSSLAPYGTDVIIVTNSSVLGCNLSNDCFTPSNVAVDVSDEIIWYNGDTVPHTVTSGNSEAGPDGKFDSSLFLPGKTFSVKFEDYEPGVYQYLCLIHPWMIGQVTVVDYDNSKNDKALIQPVFQPKNSIMLWADKLVYEEGSTIKITGNMLNDVSIVNLNVYNPSKLNIVNERVTISENGMFEKEFDTSHYLWYENGEYVVKVEDGNGNTNKITLMIDEPQKQFVALAQVSPTLPIDSSPVDNHNKGNEVEENKHLKAELENYGIGIDNLDIHIENLYKIINDLKGFFGSIFS